MFILLERPREGLQTMTSRAGKDTEVDVGWDLEAEGQRHHGEVEGADAVDLLEGVGVVRPHVRLVGLLGGLVEVVVLLYQLVQLRNDNSATV